MELSPGEAANRPAEPSSVHFAHPVLGCSLFVSLNAGPLVVCFLLPVSIFMQYWRFRKVIPKHVELDIKRLKAEHRIVDPKALLYTSIVLFCLFIAFFTHPVHHNEPAIYCLLGMVGVCLSVSRHHIR